LSFIIRETGVGHPASKTESAVTPAKGMSQVRV
jgi:hypothetical protein